MLNKNLLFVCILFFICVLVNAQSNDESSKKKRYPNHPSNCCHNIFGSPGAISRSTIAVSSNNQISAPVFAQTWIGLGYQMNLINIDDSSDWDMGHGFKLLARHSFLQVNDNIGFGILFSGKLSFLKEMNWISPETGIVIKIKDANFITDSGLIFGASLHGNIIKPLGFGIGAGFSANFITANKETFLTLLYGEVDLDYKVFDLGFALNAGLKFDINRYFIEIGSDVIFSFYRKDSYTYSPRNDSTNIIRSDSVHNEASMLRISPYILFGSRL